MCDCRNNIEAKLLERFKENSSEVRDHSVSLQGYGLVIRDNKMVEVPMTRYNCDAVFPLKKGGEKRKSQVRNMIFNYCPFCGEKTEKEGA